jgi:tight adherence protein B
VSEDHIVLLIYLSVFFGALFFVVYRYSERFFDWLRFQSIGTRDYIVDRLALMFVEVSPNKVLLVQFIISFGFGIFVFLLFLPLVPIGIIAGGMVTFVGWKVPRPLVDYFYIRRVKKFEEQMIDALGLMANGLKSGLSVVQAISLVVKEMPNPIHQEMNLVLNENRLGVSVEEAFSNLAKRVKSDDVEMFVTSINILKETGGNLAETFDTISATVRERLKIEKKIDSMTQSGFFQGMVLLATPIAIGAYMYVSDPETMKPMFTTNIGWGILLVVLILEAVAYFAITKIVKIDV